MVAPVNGMDLRRMRAMHSDSEPLRVKSTEPEPSAAVDRNNDDLVRAFVSAKENDARALPSGNDRVLFAGMNPESVPKELAALRLTGTDVVDVKASNVADIDDFVASLGLDPSKSNKVASILHAAPKEELGELAAISKIWAAAERGGAAPSRLVLSGHSAGDSVYANGSLLRFDHFRELARAMPRAASFVEDIHLSGCNTALNATASETRSQWTAAFPGLQTLWGYQGSCAMAPGEDMKAWEQRTRGRAQAIVLDTSLLASGVTVSDRAGHLDGKSIRAPVEKLQAALVVAQADFRNLFEGDWPLDGDEKADNPYMPHGLYQTYEILKEGAAHPGISVADARANDRKAGQLLRMRYYDGVRASFQSTYASALKAGFEAAKIDTPDFAQLDRRHALATIRSFMIATEKTPSPAVREARNVLRAFGELDPDFIPTQWCAHR